MLGRVGEYLEMVKVAHTVFALPFALMGAFLAAGGMPAGRTVFTSSLRWSGPQRSDGVQPRGRRGDRREESAHEGPGDPADR
jgi:4-hydroxybenzoate polyprenyltransferase